MIGVPQFCGNEDVFTGNPSSGKSGLQRLAHLTLVLVSFRTIKVSKSRHQRVLGCTFRHDRIGNQGAKAEYGHLAGSVVQRNSGRPKIRRFDHDDASAASRLQHYARIRGRPIFDISTAPPVGCDAILTPF
jgi:hypothetical protein